jgi:serine/threonine-protein kinase RIO1
MCYVTTMMSVEMKSNEGEKRSVYEISLEKAFKMLAEVCFIHAYLSTFNKNASRDKK